MTRARRNDRIRGARHATLSIAFVCGSLFAGCHGQISEPLEDPFLGGVDPSDPSNPANPGANPGGNPGTNPGGNPSNPSSLPTTGGTNGGGPDVPLCAATEARPKQAFLRRLTGLEYRNTLRDLFPGITLPAVDIAAEHRVDGFLNNATGQATSPLLIEQYRTAAAAIATTVTGNLSWAPCNGTGDGRACVTSIGHALATRAYRRPLTTVERDQIKAFAEGAFTEFGFGDATRVVVQGILQAPQFIYRPEFGDTREMRDGMIRLTGHEMATRLSYLLFRTMPDAALLDAAATGKLDTAAGVETELRRMLADPRAKDAATEFHTQWLRLDRFNDFAPDATMFPMFTADVKNAVAESTRKFVEHAFWNTGTVASFFNDKSVFVNDALAGLYGVARPGSTALVKSEFPGDTRAGILTQPGVLAARSSAKRHAPILRGTFVRDTILCAPLPPPPPEVNTSLPAGAVDKPRTTREHIEETHLGPACVGCHRAIDGVGFTFENYDAVGRYVTTENGRPVNPTGRIFAVPGIPDQEVPNAVALAKVLGDSSQVKQCIASHWFRYALGRSVDGDKSAECAVQRLGASLERTGDMKQMLIELVLSDAFRFRPVP